MNLLVINNLHTSHKYKASQLPLHKQDETKHQCQTSPEFPKPKLRHIIKQLCKEPLGAHAQPHIPALHSVSMHAHTATESMIEN